MKKRQCSVLHHVLEGNVRFSRTVKDVLSLRTAARKPWPMGQIWPMVHFRVTRMAMSTNKISANFLDCQMNQVKVETLY